MIIEIERLQGGIMKKTVVELFAGVGGFRVGLNKAELTNDKVIEKDDWNFVWTNQWEPSTKAQDAFDCYVTRFGQNENHSNEDITTVNKKDIPNHSLLVGGFPCQDYSVARTLSGEKGLEGKKGVLFWEIADILKHKKPPFVLLENVDRLLKSPSKQRGRDFGVMLRVFADNGYAVEWRVINAAEYGLPQRRRRVFIFAFHKSTEYYKEHTKNLDNTILEEGLFVNTFNIKQEYDRKSESSVAKKDYEDLASVSDSFECNFQNSGFMYKHKITTMKTLPIIEKQVALKEVVEKDNIDDKYFINIEKIDKWKYLKGAKRIERTKPNGEKYFFTEGNMDFPDSLNKPGRTMLTSETSINRSSHVIEDIESKKLRIITPIEAERLNCFPDGWTNTGMTDKRRYFMMGNALVVGIVKRLGEEIAKIIENEK